MLKKLLLSSVLVIASVSVNGAEAQNQGKINTDVRPVPIFNTQNQQVGFIRDDGRAVSTTGAPVSSPPLNITILASNRDSNGDGRLDEYAVMGDGSVVFIGETQENSNPPQIPCIPGITCQNNSSSGGGGNGGGNSGGGNGGNNGGGNSGGGNNGGNGGGDTGASVPDYNSNPQQPVSKDFGSIPAQNPYADQGASTTGGNPAGSVTISAYDVIADGGKHNKLTQEFSGMSELYWGEQRTPPLIDPRKIASRTPDLMADKDARPQLKEAYKYVSFDQLPAPQNIGVDDEILKTSMAVYQPLRRIRKDHLEDEQYRDDMIDSANTLVGVAISTMGFLDKTVGASITQIQDNADRNAMQEILKQVSWSTTKLANQDRGQIFRDVDEKIEACLEESLTNKSAKKKLTKGITRKRANYECHPSCGAQPKPGNPFRPTGQDQTKAGNGSYTYCVCCAETDEKLNKLGEEDYTPVALTVDKSKGLYTIAQRLWWGVGKPPEDNDPTNIALKQFKWLYGDIIIKPEAASGGQPYYSSTYQMPRVSPARLVAMYKNKCKYTDDMQTPLGEEGDCKELANDFNVEYGICPSLMKIFEHWEEITNPKSGGSASNQSEIPKWFAEASLGQPLTGDLIKKFLSANGDPVTKLANGEEKQRLSRIIENFCEASAVAALARLHGALSAATQDHLVLTESISENDKGKLSALQSRFGSYLAAAEADLNSKYKVQSLVTALSVDSDRRKTAELAAMQETVNSLSDLNVVGSQPATAFGYTRWNRNGGGAGGNSATRQAQAINAPIVNDPISTVSRNSERLDPINSLYNRLNNNR